MRDFGTPAGYFSEKIQKPKIDPFRRRLKKIGEERPPPVGSFKAIISLFMATPPLRGANECAEPPKYDTKKSASALSSAWEHGARGMHRGYLFAILLFACQASAWAGPSPDTGENAASATSVTKSPGERAVQTDPVIAVIRSKLAGRALSSNADPADIAALQAFYGNSSAARLWITDMGLSARAQTALF